MDVAQKEEPEIEMEMGARGCVMAKSSGQAQSKHIHGSVCLVHAELIQLIS